MFVYIYHISTGKNTRQMNRLIELCSFFGQGVVICVWLPPLHVSTKKHVLLSLQCLYICVGISLSCFLTLSLSLPPPPSSSCLPLYLNILFSMCMCLSVVWECVFHSEKKRVSVQVQGNSWYQRVESLSLFLSLSLIFCLSVALLPV
jgi:hypothetical protein